MSHPTDSPTPEQPAADAAHPEAGHPEANWAAERAEAEEALRPSSLVRDELPDGPMSAAPSVEDIEEAMRDVVDPELMVNVVDLGLVYGIHVDEQNNATIDMTLTSPTCPLTDQIEYDMKRVLDGLVNGVTINWVWLPPWSLEMITEDGREQLRSIGFNV